MVPLNTDGPSAELPTARRRLWIWRRRSGDHGSTRVVGGSSHQEIKTAFDPLGIERETPDEIEQEEDL
jgi:hypothetical protein